MDALLSIPLVSFFFLPALSSWSTSLNFMFFYLQWSMLILTHAAWKVEFLGTLFIRTLFYLLPSYLFLLFDIGMPSIAANIKEHGDLAIASAREHGGYGRNGRWWRVLFWSTFNVVLGVALQTAVRIVATSRELGLRGPLKIALVLPYPWAIFKDIARGFLLRELLGYLIHRYTMHSSSAPLRARHLAWYHDLPATYSMAAHYDHPLAYVVRVVLPTYIPAVLFNFHLLTYHLFLALVSLEELFTHSGYVSLPTGLILGRMARRQELHLMTNGKGNFAPYGAADLLAGTALGSDVFVDMLEEAEAHDVPDKVSRRAKGAGKQAKAKTNRVVRKLRGADDEQYKESRY